MKPNHHSLAYKQQKQPNKTYKDLKQKQKMKIADWMFRETCIFYKENGEIASFCPNDPKAPEKVKKVIVTDMDKVYYPPKMIVPLI